MYGHMITKFSRMGVILHWYACGVDGWSGGRSVYGHVITKFSRMGSLPQVIFLPMALHCTRFALESFAINNVIIIIKLKVTD